MRVTARSGIYAVVHGGVLDPGVHFLSKPFTPDQLAAKVHMVLDQ